MYHSQHRSQFFVVMLMCLCIFLIYSWWPRKSKGALVNSQIIFMCCSLRMHKCTLVFKPGFVNQDTSLEPRICPMHYIFAHIDDICIQSFTTWAMIKAICNKCKRIKNLQHMLHIYLKINTRHVHKNNNQYWIYPPEYAAHNFVCQYNNHEIMLTFGLNTTWHSHINMICFIMHALEKQNMKYIWGLHEKYTWIDNLYVPVIQISQYMQLVPQLNFDRATVI